jgi:hypothetical protein
MNIKGWRLACAHNPHQALAVSKDHIPRAIARVSKNGSDDILEARPWNALE